jgi:hypothetical protein
MKSAFKMLMLFLTIVTPSFEVEVSCADCKSNTVDVAHSLDNAINYCFVFDLELNLKNVSLLNTNCGGYNFSETLTFHGVGNDVETGDYRVVIQLLYDFKLLSQAVLLCAIYILLFLLVPISLWTLMCSTRKRLIDKLWGTTVLMSNMDIINVQTFCFGTLCKCFSKCPGRWICFLLYFGLVDGVSAVGTESFDGGGILAAVAMTASAVGLAVGVFIEVNKIHFLKIHGCLW